MERVLSSAAWASSSCVSRLARRWERSSPPKVCDVGFPNLRSLKTGCLADGPSGPTCTTDSLSVGDSQLGGQRKRPEEDRRPTIKADVMYQFSVWISNLMLERVGRLGAVADGTVAPGSSMADHRLIMDGFHRSRAGSPRQESSEGSGTASPTTTGIGGGRWMARGPRS